MNHIIVEKIKNKLSSTKLTKLFLGEALNTTCYLINLSHSSPFKGDVPKRVLTRKDVSHLKLRVFGCKAFIHVPKDQEAS